ncbi:MAG: class I SAM-dependent methyltransferase [SAR202 cluster bacterium]|nr:class I SAM-dependent methyltransferase [SAR202 cluster bacterium]
MTDAIYRRDTCRLCGGPDLSLIMPLAPTPIGDDFVPPERSEEPQDSYPLDVYLCQQCSHVQLLDVVNPEIIYRKYNYVTVSSPGLPKHFQQYVDAVINNLEVSRDSFVVDLGSNDGTLLKCFQASGMNVLGVDPAVDIARAATEQGTETLPHFFDSALGQQIRRERGAARIVTANNIFANVDDLDSITDGIRHLLADNGVFVFETGYLLGMVENLVFDNVYHEHLSYYAAKPLENFFRRHGMELFDAERVPTKGGSLRGFVQLANGPRKVSQNVSDLIDLEIERGLGDAKTFETYMAKINSAKAETLAFVDSARARGETVAGYGASHSVTTIMYHFDLTDRLDFLVDDNPRKQNLVSPGCHIPVWAPDALYDKRPDHVLVLPWRFRDAIVQQHDAYLAKGGHFVVPLPEFEVI